MTRLGHISISIRLLDAAVIFLWVTALGLLVADTLRIGPPTFLSRWATMLGLLAVAGTMACLSAYMLRTLRLEQDVAEIHDELEMRRLGVQHGSPLN